MSKNKTKQKPMDTSNFQGFFNEVIQNLYCSLGLKKRDEEIGRIVSSLNSKQSTSVLSAKNQVQQLGVQIKSGQQPSNFENEYRYNTKSNNLKEQPVKLQPIKNKEHTEFLNFLDDLTSAMVGHKIADIPAHKRVEVVTECANIFSNFIIEYVRHHYGPKHALRLKSIRDFADKGIFDKFEELDHAFNDAFHAFVNILQNSTILVK